MSDIAELFSRDPLKMSDQDIDTIIEHLRKSRAQYNLGVKGAGNMKATKAPAKPKAVAVTGVSLADLGL